MNQSQYDLFLSVGTFLCALGAVLNLFLIKRRGNSALLLSAAFLAFGGLLWMLKSHAPQGYVTVAGVMIAILLVGDVIWRSKDQDRPQ